MKLNKKNGAEHYGKLLKSAGRKRKNELEIYCSIMDCIEDILADCPEENKMLLIKSLIAYFDGRNSNVLFLGIVQITYAILLGLMAIFPSLGMPNGNLYMIVIILLITVFIFCRLLNSDMDFKQTIIIRVLNDKLEELLNTKEVTENGERKQKSCKKHKRKR